MKLWEPLNLIVKNKSNIYLCLYAWELYKTVTARKINSLFLEPLYTSLWQAIFRDQLGR